jgi:hypothetical protein
VEGAKVEVRRLWDLGRVEVSLWRNRRQLSDGDPLGGDGGQESVIDIVVGEYNEAKVNYDIIEEKPPNFQELLDMICRISGRAPRECRRYFAFHNYHVQAALTDLMAPP